MIRTTARLTAFVTRKPSVFTAAARFASFDVTAGLSEEEQEYQSMALQFAANELAPHAEKWDATHFFPQDTLREAAALGFAGMYVDPELGGTGLTRKDGAIIFEALATGCVSTTAYLTIHNMCAWMLNTYGSEEIRQRYLPRMCGLELFSSYCLTEPGSGSDAASLSTTAVREGDDYVLNGSKAFISGGGVSDLYLVMARTGGPGPKGISCFVVDKDTPGLTFGAQENKMGWNSQPTSAVFFEGCKVPVANMVGEEGNGFTMAMKALDGGRINIGTTAVGGAIAALDHAVEHVKVRKQFGKSISEFQNTQFKLADMATQIQASRMLIQSAASLLDAKDPRSPQHCAMAKRFATDASFEVVNDALQLFGGYGYLKDYPIERILRDVRVHSILEGTNQVMRMIVSRSLLRD